LKRSIPSVAGTTVLIYISILILLVHGISYGRDNKSTLENQVKAAYIYNFTKFVYWNTLPQITDSTPATICIIGDGSISSILGSFLKTQGKEHYLHIKTTTTDDVDLSGCQIVYIGRIEDQKLPEFLQHIESRNILTVSDIPGFTAKGGMIGFYYDKGKIKIEINMIAVANAKLQISAKLLEVARLTRSGKTE